MQAIVPQYKRYTIESYARYVLDDPEVKALMHKFTTYLKAADKLIDSFEGLVDSELVKFDSQEELEAARAFNRVTEETKNTQLKALLSKKYSVPALGDVVKREATEPHPNHTDVPLIQFQQFANTLHFQDYFLTGSLYLMSGAYFAKDIDLARQMHLVFAVFLWSFTEPVILADRDTFYEYNPLLRHERLAFLEKFRDYVHFDLWNEDDYEKKNRTGTVLRLDLDRPETGYVVIQHCGDRPNICNRSVLINEKNLEELQADSGHLVVLDLST